MTESEGPDNGLEVEGGSLFDCINAAMDSFEIPPEWRERLKIGGAMSGVMSVCSLDDRYSAGNWNNDNANRHGQVCVKKEEELQQRI